MTPGRCVYFYRQLSPLQGARGLASKSEQADRDTSTSVNFHGRSSPASRMFFLRVRRTIAGSRPPPVPSWEPLLIAMRWAVERLFAFGRRSRAPFQWSAHSMDGRFSANPLASEGNDFWSADIAGAKSAINTSSTSAIRLSAAHSGAWILTLRGSYIVAVV